jgi:hypothetical protein
MTPLLSGGKPAFPEILHIETLLRVESPSIENPQLNFNNLRVGKAGLPPLFSDLQRLFAALTNHC